MRNTRMVFGLIFGGDAAVGSVCLRVCTTGLSPTLREVILLE